MHDVVWDANARRRLKWELKQNWLQGWWYGKRTDLFDANISANKISLLQDQSYTESSGPEEG